MRIAIDAMGGDYAPREIVRGAVLAIRHLKKEITTVYMVGDQNAIMLELIACKADVGGFLEIVHAPENVQMDESPAAAVRRKKQASINICMNMLRDGKADAVISAGNSGAVCTSAVMTLGRIPGVARPVIAMAMPTRRPGRPFLLIDAGANTDCEPEWLSQFAIMGTVYSRHVLRRANPVVGLLSIGTEDCKGNELTKKAFPLLKALPGINFRGNCEGHDLFEGDLDVIVTDGFVGNIVLKTIESAARAIGGWMKEEFVRHPLRQIGALFLRGALMAMKRKMDPEVYGGAPLLGVPGTVIITHGASSSRAIYHAVIAGINAARNNATKEIEERLNNPGAPVSTLPAETAPILEHVEPPEA